MWTRAMSTTVRDFVLRSNIEKIAADSMFRLKLPEGDYATMEYAKSDDVYDLKHTVVPDKYKGHGVGSIFAEKTFDYIIEQKWRMKLTCEFLKDFYKKNYDKYHPYVIEHTWTFRA